ncbi:MAG TPA: GNAT family protein [Flavisolibacter sp.]|jgi:ribosomal-protein-serine acetyltransferase
MTTPFSEKILIADTDIILEPIDDHHAHLLLNLVNDNRPALRQWLPWVDRMRTIENFRWYINRCKEQHEEKTDYSYVVKVKEQAAGRIGIHYIDQQNKSGAIGYWIGSDFSGRGIITKACVALINHCFTELELNRLEIKCATRNYKSAAVAERLSFTKEGVLRQAEWVNGQAVDLSVYAMLKTEWVMKQNS